MWRGGEGRGREREEEREREGEMEGEGKNSCRRGSLLSPGVAPVAGGRLALPGSYQWVQDRSGAPGLGPREQRPHPTCPWSLGAEGGPVGCIGCQQPASASASALTARLLPYSFLLFSFIGLF